MLKNLSDIYPSQVLNYMADDNNKAKKYLNDFILFINSINNNYNILLLMETLNSYNIRGDRLVTFIEKGCNYDLNSFYKVIDYLIQNKLKKNKVKVLIKRN